MTTPATCGARPRCPSATRRGPISPATAADTAGSNMSRTRSHRICCNTCRSTDSIKISRLVADQSLEPRSSAQRDRLCRMGSRPVAFRLAAVRFDRDRRRHGRDVRPQSLERGLRLARRLRRFARRSDRLDRRSARVHRPQRHARRIPPRSPAPRRCRRQSARASILARPWPTKIELPPGERSRSRFPARRGGKRRRGARASSPAIAPPISMRSRPTSSANGTKSSARSSSRRRIARWTSCSTAGCSTRR